MGTAPAVVIRAGDGSNVRVDSFPLILGRSVPGSPLQPDCDLASLDTEGRISRQHASVDWQDGRMVVTDLGSTNGTVLDGRSLVPHQPAPLGPRSELVLGQVALVVEVEAPAPAAAGPPSAATMIERPPDRAVGSGAQPQMPAPAEAPTPAEPAAPAAPAAQPFSLPAAPDAFAESVLRMLRDPGLGRIVLEPGRRLRLRRDGEWIPAGDADVSREAWSAFWESFCREAQVSLSARGYVAAALGDGVLAEAFLPPLSRIPLFMAERRPAPLGLDGMVAAGLVEVATVGTLRQLLRGRQGMLVAGPARSGRTSLLESLVDAVPRGERVAVVERRPGMRVASPEAVRLRSPKGQGEGAVEVAMYASPDWIVVDDAEPEAAAAAAWRQSAGGPTALMAARTTDLAAWTARAADALTRAGSSERAAALIAAAFPVTIRLAPGPDGFVIQGIDRV